MKTYNVSLGAIAGVEITVEVPEGVSPEFAAFTEMEDVKSEYSITLPNGALLWIDLADLEVMAIEEDDA